MKYIEVYDKMLEIFNKVPQISRYLCQYYDIEINTDKKVIDLISENSNFNKSVKSILEFVDNFYDFGGITDELYDEFKRLMDVEYKPIKRIVFAANDKIDVIHDVTYNESTVVEDDNKYLSFTKCILNDYGELVDISEYGTVRYMDLVLYFGDDVYERMTSNCTQIEMKFYLAYINYLRRYYNNEDNFNMGKYPELLPQYSLKNRTKTIKENGGRREIVHRIDFAFVLNNKVILIEIDGKEHYSIKNYGYYNADFNRISEERAIDRELTLDGYEIYRFLNQDIESRADDELNEYLSPFFTKLFKKHNIEL